MAEQNQTVDQQEQTSSEDRFFGVKFQHNITGHEMFKIF